MSAAIAIPKVDDADLAERVSLGAAALALPLARPQVDCLVAYVRLMARWNETYNLTAVRDPRAMVTQHIVDCLAAAAVLVRRRPRLPRERLLDVGSGAGLPGLVFGVVAPKLEVVCIDSVGKKTAFITQAAGTLGLENVRAVQGRVEAFADGRFDVVASRAFASLRDFIEGSRHLMAEQGVWMAMKAKAPTAELAQLDSVAFHVEPLSVPGTSAERCIVWLAPKS